MTDDDTHAQGVALADEDDTANVFDGVRHYENVCSQPETTRIELVARSKLPSSVEVKETVKGVTFVARDVCALGHFPKDFSHLHSWLQLHHKGEAIDKALSRLIIGHRCATRNRKNVANKRTPVFHDVLIHWVRAITEKYDFLAGTENDNDGTGSGSISSGFFMMYEDFPSKKSGEVVCFEHVIEREEHWRWFPSEAAAASFRALMWRYFKLSDHERRNTLLHVPFVDQPMPKVLVVRRDEDRHFSEREVVEFLQNKFGRVANVSLAQYDKPPRGKALLPIPSYPAQAAQLMETDVLIVAHGALLSSTVLMRPGAVVIELFPHNFRYHMYEELARVLRLEYVPVEGDTVSPAGCCHGRKWSGLDDAMDAPASAKTGRLRKWGSDVREANKGVLERVHFGYGLNGLRECKKCDIAVSQSQWFHIVKNALITVWLANSRFTNVHDFDVRR